MSAGEERLDDLQLAGLKIYQKTRGFRFGMDAVLLSDFVHAGPGDLVADFGAGTGILPLLLWGRGKGERFEAFEIQADMADMAEAMAPLPLLDMADLGDSALDHPRALLLVQTLSKRKITVLHASSPVAN